MSTFSKLRVGPKRASAGVPTLNLVVSCDPTAASATTGKTLPAGAVVTGIVSLGGATGGTNPTIDVGISTDPDYFANELDADTAATAATATAAWYTALTADTLVYAGVGASAATGGTTSVLIQYYIEDSTGGVNN